MALNSVLLVPISILKMPRNPLINCRNNEYLHIYGVIHLFECMGHVSFIPFTEYAIQRRRRRSGRERERKRHSYTKYT